MKRENIMESDAIVDPYVETDLKFGKRVVCRKTSNNITLCTVEKKKDLWKIIFILLGMLVIIVLFSLKITITMI